jgi:two-component system sporulation sensor kinase C
MLAEIERINGMVEELLLYGRPQSLHLGEVDLALIWNSITLLAASEIESHQQQVERPNRSDVPSIVADAERLRQVFLNLLKNAIEATPPRGKIYIEIEPKNDNRRQGVEIQVKDTGHGIAPEERERIFDLFYSRKRGGSGLGLPICRKIIENHGGHIRVESILGRGTNVRVWLPVQQEPRS